MREKSRSQRRDRAAKALGDPMYFADLYMRPFDENWVEELPPFAEDMAAFILGARRGAIILPPEFLKTTVGSQLIPLWLTARYTWAGKLLRGMLLSEEEGMSQANLSVVAWHIDNNEYLRADFADDHGKPMMVPDPQEHTWREDAIIVKRHGTSKDPTWQAKGLDSKGIHGRRLDWLIGDDVVTPKNAFSPAERKKGLRIWDLQITTRLVRSGRAVVLGNFNHEKDLTSTLAARKSYEVFRRPAIHKPNAPEVAEENIDVGVPLWPQNWDRERLRTEQAEKPNTYRRIFLLDPRAERGEKLQLDWLRVIEPDDTPMEDCTFVVSIDPTPGGEQSDLDFSNVTVFAHHGGALLDLIFTIDTRGGLDEKIAILGAVHDRFNKVGNGVVAIGWAKQSADSYFRQAFVLARSDIEHKCHAVSTPGSKEERLEGLGPLAKTGYFRVWAEVLDAITSDDEDQFQELTFAEQWRDFPDGKHDDKLDGADVGIRTFVEHGQGQDVEYELAAA